MITLMEIREKEIGYPNQAKTVVENKIYKENALVQVHLSSQKG